MPERARGSLVGLKRPLAASQPTAVPIETAENQLLGLSPVQPQTQHPFVATTPAPAATNPVPHAVPLDRPDLPKRERLTAWSVRLPESVYENLRETAHRQRVPMTQLLVEALRRYLPPID